MTLSLLLSGALVACSGQEPSRASTGEEELAESGPQAGSTAGEPDEDRILPVLVPGFGLGGSGSECKFTDDPYNTCI